MSGAAADAGEALSIQSVTKTFAGQRALSDVGFAVKRGAISALLGMNGSGKSTLIKILAGIYAPDPGARLLVAGQQVALPLTPAVSHHSGLRFLHQDVGLVDSLTIADNFAFADRFYSHGGVFGRIDVKRHHAHVGRTLEMLGIRENPRRIVADLDPTTRTMVGVARAFQDRDELGTGVFARRVLVLDEPTASLPAREVDKVLTLLETLRRNGGTAIYVSHRTEEVRRIADQLIILRDGQLIADEPTGEMSVSDIVARIVGKKVAKVRIARAREREGNVVFAATALRGERIADLSMKIKSGEILGVAGLIGCGRSELVRIVCGAQRAEAGHMTLDGKIFAPASPADAVQRGVACVPQNRRRDGAVLTMNVGENLTLGRLGDYTRGAAVSQQKERSAGREMLSRYSVKPARLDCSIALLSGGNQQKVVVARAASGQVRMLVLDEPTQGVDAVAKQEIANIVRQLADSGVAVIVASTDNDELADLCDRVIVLNRGAHTATLEADAITDEALTLACTESQTSQSLSS
jgi:ribose transport system ATP-binding protein